MKAHTAHTPGPWHIGRSNFGGIDTRTIENGAAIICHMADTESSGSPAPKANAALIASAPDLLAALRAMLEAYAPGHATTAEIEGDEALHPAVFLARKAILNAAGCFCEEDRIRIQNAIAKAEGGAE